MFLATCVILTALVIILIIRLKQKQKAMVNAGVIPVFGKEMQNLLTILILFDTSFLLRYFTDQYFYLPDEDRNVYCFTQDGREQLCHPFYGIVYN